MTFLFTDIEGSTRLWEEHPEAIRAALALHDALVHGAIEAQSGRVVKSTGDGAFAVFPSPQRGARSAVDAQVALADADWPAGAALSVRMGLHVGEANEQDGDFFGPDVNRAARVMSAAHGGQVVCTAAVAEFARASCALVDLGEHRLRDLQSPVHLFQVDPPGHASVFPPLRSLDAYRSNLPYELSSFVGRAVELRQVAAEMRSARIVSIVGVGGVGKTRLALQVGSELLPDYADGVWLCELASVLEPEDLSDAVAAAVGYAPPQGVSVADGLPRHLERKELLLILDNCEHLVDAVAEFVAATTTHTARVSVLVTSREALGVRGEHAAPLASLPLPAGVDAKSVLASDAGALFVARATEARGEFSINATNGQSIRDLCARLDGIPLAIELAAAQTTMMTSAEILARLDKQFRLLTGGRRTRLERHQTLRAAIDWSYDLLSDDERALLDRLAVCVGGFDLDGTVAIAAGIGADEFDAVELLASLVAKSLVERNERHGATRYRLLEMIRQYAGEQLNSTGTAEAARDDHSRYYRSVAIRLFAETATAAGFDALARLDSETANIAAAARWLLATDRVAELLAFFRDLPYVDGFMLPISTTDEFGTIAAEAIERPHAQSHVGFPEACYWVGNRAYFDGDMATYRSLVDVAQSSPHSDGSTIAIFMRAVPAIFDGDAAGAVRWSEQAVEHARLGGDQMLLAFLLAQLAGFQQVRDPELGLRTAEAALAVARTTGSAVASLYPLLALTTSARYLDPKRALDAAEEALRTDATQRQIVSNIVNGNVGDIRFANGQVTEGLAAFRGALRSYADAGARTVFTVCLGELASALTPIDPFAAVDLAALAESDAIAPYAAFGLPDLATLAEDRPTDVASARDRVAKLSPDNATALVFTTIDRLIAEHST